MPITREYRERYQKIKKIASFLRNFSSQSNLFVVEGVNWIEELKRTCYNMRKKNGGNNKEIRTIKLLRGAKRKENPEEKLLVSAVSA